MVYITMMTQTMVIVTELMMAHTILMVTVSTATTTQTMVMRSSLVCHGTSTDWILLDIYCQDVYEYFEQIIKHVWYYDNYEYIVVSACLEYLGDNACSFLLYNND